MELVFLVPGIGDAGRAGSRTAKLIGKTASKADEVVEIVGITKRGKKCFGAIQRKNIGHLRKSLSNIQETRSLSREGKVFLEATGDPGALGFVYSGIKRGDKQVFKFGKGKGILFDVHANPNDFRHYHIYDISGGTLGKQYNNFGQLAGKKQSYHFWDVIPLDLITY